ncbi:C40 family peptidase [Curvivirga aplysinae]|uniref:C40 family peptidase n=1 Tax=Curvivirga aplysinae TaxID=2529852 RepID=UPI0012BD0864|nr:C40 family peptidase [Curvivirga aplysinae]MTI11192.1 peptidase P60 [Curvivirga aplysinae]
MTIQLDTRLNAWRPDLADIALKGKVDASRFIQAEIASPHTSITSLRRGPGFEHPVDKELLRGEEVHIFEEKDGWCWVQSKRDKYVGYCETKCLTKGKLNLTHRINVLRSSVFKEASLKTLIIDQLSLNSEVEVVNSEGKFSQLSCGGWVYSKHLVSLHEYILPFQVAAKFYLNSPYIWGGNGHLGVDCSGLIQMAAYAAGYTIPRDTDMQEDFFTEEVDGLDNIQVGDLLFWPGHVAIYDGEGIAIHANATEMMTCAHYLEFLLPHIEQQEGTPLRSIKRPNFDLKTDP